MEARLINWPGGEHLFRLGIEQLRTLQQRTDCGAEHLANRIAGGQWMVDDFREVFRCGLIGGGMEKVRAVQLVDRILEDGVFIRFKAPALEILGDCLYGPADDPVGEPMPVTPTPETEQTASGNSAPITD